MYKNVVSRYERRLGCLLIMIFFCVTSFAQGITTAEIYGRVVDLSGEFLPGASVYVEHHPTGTRVGTVSDDNGFFRMPNLSVGGPYSLNVSFVGYTTFVENDLFLSLGQSYEVTVPLGTDNLKINEVTVSAFKDNRYGVADGNARGAQTVISRRGINKLPTLTGNMNDFLRMTPQANMVGDGISLGGMNTRYNSLMIDGTVSNDVFGLCANGMNGGRAGVSPISIESIEQFQVVLAPFDVREGGFVGGGINAVTKSGTNELKGSFYTKFRNEYLAGKTPTFHFDGERKRLQDFSARISGVTLGGAIIKNKLFFFVNGELRDDETPQYFNLINYKGNSDGSVLERIQDKFRDYGYDPGGYEGSNRRLKGKKLLMKINWNINANNRLMLRHQYTKGENIYPFSSTPNTLFFHNSGEYQSSVSHSSALELKSHWGHNFSNLLKVGYTYVNDDEDPLGANFPGITIYDGEASIVAGSRVFATGNQVKQKILTFTDDFQIYKGAHTLTAGMHHEFYNIYNLFIRRAFGEYTFNSVNDFLNEVSPSYYRIGYSLLDDVRGDGSSAAADFNFFQLGFYLQDDWHVSDRFKVTAGLRLDVPIFNDQPKAIADFNNITLPLLEKYHNLRGVRAGQMPSSQFMWSPRVGFSWDVRGNKQIVLRGGVGSFSSRIPFVWPAGSYSNNGMMIGDYSQRDGVVFNPEWDKQPLGPDEAPKGGQIDLFVKDFKFPQVLRGDLALDYHLPGGWFATVEFLYTKTLNNVLWKNVNMKPAWGHATGTPDDRPLYKTYRNGIDDRYGQIMLGDNTQRGYTYNLTTQVRKEFKCGLGLSIAHNFGRAKSVFDGTSAQNSSQWNYLVSSPVPRNNAQLGYSSFDMGHRIVGALTWSGDFFGHTKTNIGIYYNGQSGKRFSYTYNDPKGAFTDEAYGGPQLIYVPKNSQQIILGAIDPITNNLTPFDRNSADFKNMWYELDNYIDGDNYLKHRRGEYAQRNGSRLPWENVFDLKITQDLFTNIGERRHTLQLSVDIFNVGNLLNKNWGRRYFVANNQVPLIRFEGMDGDGTTPVFSFEPPQGDEPWYITDSGLNSARWQGQVGVRYFF